MNNDKNKGSGKRGAGISNQDRYLWEFVAKTITPLSDRQRNRLVVDASPPASQPQSWETKLPDIRLREAETVNPRNKNTENKTDSRTTYRLRQGKMPIEGVLDLHGLHQTAAQSRFFSFLHESSMMGKRCVLVITGKGFRGDAGETGVLRRMLPLWLEMDPAAHLVLSFSPARPKDGGGGAFYILLRRQRANL